jgi:hypothetical protein
MPNNKRTRKIYYLDNQLAVNNYLPDVRHFEFSLLLYLYREAGYDVARKWLDDLKRFEAERNDPNRVKPEPTNLNYKHGNHKGKTRITTGMGKPGEPSDLVGLEEIALGQKQTALMMLKSYGVEISQNYVNFCLKLHKDVEYQNEQAS